MGRNLISLTANQLAWYKKILSKFNDLFNHSLTNLVFFKQNIFLYLLKSCKCIVHGVFKTTNKVFKVTLFIISNEANILR